jgi:tetratricopeptide (TPR) repeat protein
MEIVRQATGLTGDEPATQGRQRLADLLAGLPNADAVLDGLAPLVGLGGEEAAVEECFWAVRTFLEELARRAPLVVIFDDIHWAEQTLLDLIEHVADWSRDAPVLLLCVARPELLEMRPTWGGGKLSATSTLLTPLAPGHCAELIRTLIGTDEIDVELQSRITESAAGNPLFVEQMLAALIDDGHLRHDGGAWRAIGDLAAVTVPPTISSLLAARLDRLARPERQVIERAAVVGQLFYLDAVAELSAPTDRSAVPLHCLALVRKELVHSERSDLPGVEAFRFLHVLLRDCAYQATSKQHRAELHEQFALWLENRLAGRAGEHDELAGYHLEQAYHYRGELRHRDEPATAEVGRRAAAHLIAAAERIQQGDRPAAATLLARATRLVPQGSPLWLRARIDIGQVLLGTGRLDEASALLRETVARAEAVGEDRLRAHARLLHLRVRLSVEADELVGETLTEAAAALQIFERTGDTLGAGQAHRAQAAAHTANGQFGPAEEAMRLAVAHAERTGDRRETRQMQRELASLLTWAPRPVRESVPLAERALARAQGTADRALQRELSAQLAVLHTMAGDDAAADAALAEAERIVREIPGSGRDPMFAGMISARIALLRGQDEHAEQALRHSCRGLARIGARAYLATRAAALADLLARAGRYEEAGTFVGTARRAAGADHLPTQADWRAAQARILAGEGQLAQALRLAEEARNLRMRTDDPDGQATVLLALADVLRRAGRDEEADTQFALAVGRCERKGNLAGAEQARAMAKAKVKALPDGALSA